MVKLFKNKRTLLSTLIFILVFALIGAFFSKEEWNSLKDISTSAFSGGLIGLILVWYEQIREDERDSRQIERDIAQVKRLQKADDIQKLADLVLLNIVPTFNKTFSAPSEKSLERYKCCISIDPHMYSDSFQQYLDICRTLVRRIDSDVLEEKWNRLARILWGCYVESQQERYFYNPTMLNVDILSDFEFSDILDMLLDIKKQVELLRKNMDLT